MSFLFGTSAMPQPKQKQLGLNEQSGSTIEQALPLPYLAGKRRFAGTFITDAFDQQTTSQSSGGKDAGKGGGGTGTNYFAGFGVAFCLGPVDGFHDLHLNGDAVFTSNTAIVPTQGGLNQRNNVATFEAKSSHGLLTGDSVVVTGANQPEFNGEFVVTKVSSTIFTYIIPGTTVIAERAKGQIRAYAKLDPIYRGAEDFIKITIPSYGVLRLYWGTETQGEDDYLAVSGTRHPAMKGVCYGVFEQFFLGLNQTNIQNVEVVLSRTPQAAWLPAVQANINDEANPAVVMYDLLTHPRCGLGLTDADFNVAELAEAATIFKAEGLGISPLITRQDSAATLLQQLGESVDATVMLDANGLLTLRVIRAPDSYAGLTTIGDDELAEIPSPKVTDWSNTNNETRLVFPNSAAAWLNDFVEWKDFAASSAMLTLAQPQTLNRDWITKKEIATALVKSAGLASSVPARTGTLTVLFTPARWAALAPGNLFKLDYTLRPNGGGYFRVIKRSLPDPGRPQFIVEYAADRSYLNLEP